jgi:hypothetical protein
VIGECSRLAVSGRSFRILVPCSVVPVVQANGSASLSRNKTATRRRTAQQVARDPAEPFVELVEILSQRTALEICVR